MRATLRNGLLLGLLLLATPAPAQMEDEYPKLQPVRTEIPPTFWERRGQKLTLYSIEMVAWLTFSAWLLLRPLPARDEPIEVTTKRELERLGSQPDDATTLSGATRCLRHYFARAFGLPAIEHTTEEFCRAIAHNEQVGGELAERLANLLRRCDAARFAATGFLSARPVLQEAAQLFEQGEARRRAWRQSQEAHLPQVAT